MTLGPSGQQATSAAQRLSTYSSPGDIAAAAVFALLELADAIRSIAPVASPYLPPPSSREGMR